MLSQGKCGCGKNGTFQPLPSMFSMRRDLEAWKSSNSSRESLVWDGSSLFGKVLPGARTGIHQEQAQRATFPWPDHQSVMPPWHCSTSPAEPLFWKRGIFPLLFHSPRNHPFLCPRCSWRVPRSKDPSSKEFGVQPYPETPDWDLCGSQGESCIPDGILA